MAELAIVDHLDIGLGIVVAVDTRDLSSIWVKNRG